jgi:hypothetical protein
MINDDGTASIVIRVTRCFCKKWPIMLPKNRFYQIYQHNFFGEINSPDIRVIFAFFIKFTEDKKLLQA